MFVSNIIKKNETLSLMSSFWTKFICLSFVVFLTVYFIIYVVLQYKHKELFSVQFGTPPETSDENKGHIKGLLEIGSQALENTKYDTVSTHYLGDIHEEEDNNNILDDLHKPDPKCFSDNLNKNNIFSLLY